MRQAWKLAAGAIAAIMMVACDPGGVEADQASTLAVEGPDEVHLRTARLGPVLYSFDDSRLVPTEVKLAIPPTFDDTAFASKLIPVARADRLGAAQCRYDEDDQPDPCDAAQESGLSLALLERPLAEYRAAFARGDIEPLDDAMMDGSEGFSVVVNEGAREAEYSFAGVGDRTLLVVQQSDDDDPALDEELARVLATIHAADPAARS
ncbi:hypothetical protein [Aurantiacibacter luteus]|uniref:Uncharacterized protein n=1 Tax=Aurantiacibacter luteus TaxID=1581420 RepID=A0A0G9MWQ5_9SPHN|nr:hypothetical protein [Aurantiacibacter luteus]KLE35207.1 hypothetical protein AAW00_01630 [Aurantiacibacter luteus]